ncbi:hypothetical protein [Falsihalocynthiibacter sp. S25ZX9]
MGSVPTEDMIGRQVMPKRYQVMKNNELAWPRIEYYPVYSACSM